MALSTAEDIRDRARDIVELVTPLSIAPVKFRRFRAENGAQFRDWAEQHKNAALRRFHARVIHSDDLPLVTNTDHAAYRLTVEITIAYAATNRAGTDGALDREDMIDKDWKELDYNLGITSRANFYDAHDCTPLGCTKEVEQGDGVDFLVITAVYEYQRAHATNTTLVGLPVDPLADVSQDSSSLKYVPADYEEWSCVLTTAGLTVDGPQHVYTCQGTTATTASRDEIGIVDLSQNNVLMTYNNAVTGWTRKSMNLPDGAIGNSWSTTSILDLSTTSGMLLLYIDATGTSSGDNEIAGLGSGTDHRYAALTAANRIKAHALAGGTATGTVDVPAGVFPLVLKVDRANSTYKVYTEDEVINVAWTNPGLGGGVFVLGDAGTGGAAPIAFLYAAMFEGTAAEDWTDADVSSLLETLGWEPAY